MYFVVAAIFIMLMAAPLSAGQQATIEIDPVTLQSGGSLNIPLTIEVNGQVVNLELKLVLTEPSKSEPGGNSYVPPAFQTRELNVVNRLKMLGQAGLYLYNKDAYKWLDSGMIPPL